MKIKSKLLSIMMVCTLLLALAGCGVKGDPTKVADISINGKEFAYGNMADCYSAGIEALSNEELDYAQASIPVRTKVSDAVPLAEKGKTVEVAQVKVYNTSSTEETKIGESKMYELNLLIQKADIKINGSDMKDATSDSVKKMVKKDWGAYALEVSKSDSGLVYANSNYQYTFTFGDDGKLTEVHIVRSSLV